MRRIIYGKLYDTDKMELVYGGLFTINKFYKDSKNNYYHVIGGCIFPISKTGFRYWAEDNLSADKYIKLFGPVEEA